MVALLVLGAAVTPLLAQNSVGTPRSFEIGQKANDFDGNSESGFAAGSGLAGKFEVPAVEKAQGDLQDAKPVYASQDALTLDSHASTRQNVESVVDLNVLRNPSPYRKLAVSATPPKTYEIAGNSLQKGLEGISAVYRVAGKPEKSANCSALALSVEQRIKMDVSKTLEIVESEVAANPACACEIVKSSISASDADVTLVVSIVQTSINAAPANMRIISQCAIASMPESVTAVQSLLAKLDPNSGEESSSSKSAKSSKSADSAKSAKSAKVASIVSAPADPLDRFYFPVITPIVTSNPVTDVNPSNRYGY